jgi:integrase
VIEKVFEACSHDNWRLVIVLTRYGGLRIPSVRQNLKWSDIDWLGGRFTVRVPKKEHLDGHETRIVPIFPEIRPYLRQAFEETPAGSVYVLHRDGYAYAGVLQAVERASVEPWPKLLQNLRASRETVLMQTYPAHVVDDWLGNYREVAIDHYLQVTDADYARASAVTASESAAKDAVSKTVQKAVQSATVGPLQRPPLRNESAASPAFAKDTAVQVPPRGVEPRFSD